MKIGIVIITYNNADYIIETLQSLKKQSYVNWTCVIVDNGSTDTTFAKINKFIASDVRFTAFRTSNNGPSAGRNYGFKRLPSEIGYIHFLDGDDCLHEKFLETTVSYLESHPEAGLVGCQFDIIDRNSKFLGPGNRSRYFPGKFGLPMKLKDSVQDTPFETFFCATGQGPFAVFRKSLFVKTTGYEESFWSHEDSDIFCQMSLLGQVHYLPVRLYKKRIHHTNLTNSNRANYGAFRNKWDLYFSQDAKINLKIEKALQYYYTRHKPCRDFKVALKAFKEFLHNQDGAKLKWSLECFISGIKDLIARKNFKEKCKQRSQVEQVLADGELPTVAVELPT